MMFKIICKIINSGNLFFDFIVLQCNKMLPNSVHIFSAMTFPPGKLTQYLKQNLYLVTFLSFVTKKVSNFWRRFLCHDFSTWKI